MARQIGILPITGRLAGLSYYEDKVNGKIVRTPGGPSKEQIQTSPTLAPVRKNNKEFSRSSSAGKLIRHSFASEISHCTNPLINRRMMTLLQSVIKADTRHTHGNRLFTSENLKQFTLFELGSKRASGDFFHFPLRVSKQDKILQTEVPIKFPTSKFTSNATHFRVTSTLAFIQFGKQVYTTDEQSSEYYGVKDEGPLLRFRHPLQSKGFCFHGMSISFFMKERKEFHLIHNQLMQGGFIRYVDLDTVKVIN